jgi:phage recombination protein Bet
MCDKDIAVRAEDTRAVAPVSEQTISDYLQAFGLANQLTKQETKQFVEIAKAFNLNPFKREIYAVPHTNKDGKRSLSIITGYEIYLKRADLNPNYDGYDTEFSTENGVSTCTCKVYRKDRKIPTSVTIRRREYDTGKSMWASKPMTMLEKVAIATAHRRAFPNDFGGMPYTKEELPEEMTTIRDVTPAPVEEASQTPPEAPVAEVQSAPAAEPARIKPTQEQIEKLNALKGAFTAEELAQFKVQYRDDIPGMIKAMSDARIAKLEAGTLHKGVEVQAEPMKHPWASPETRRKLAETAPEAIQDDSAELYSDAKPQVAIF